MRKKVKDSIAKDLVSDDRNRVKSKADFKVSRLFTVLYFSVRSPRSRNGRHLCLYCERNLERGRQSTRGHKDGARFGVRVRSWHSYGKLEDCKQSIRLGTE